jgi:DNA-binding SARP family transcriptional activator
VTIHATEFRLLGPLEVSNGSGPLAARGQKKRALLARLLLEANRTVSVEALVDGLWGEDVPPTAVKMVHIYVSQLRKELPNGTLHTRPPGYLLQTGPEAVDVLRFARLCAEARVALGDGDAAQAAERLRAALALWRGPALAEFSEPFAAAEAAHLE